MFYVKSCGLYHTGEFDRSFPPDLYLGSLDEALEFKSREDAEVWADKHGGEIIDSVNVPEVDFWKGEYNKLKENMRELANLSAFNWDTMPEDGRKKFHEMVKEIAWRY